MYVAIGCGYNTFTYLFQLNLRNDLPLFCVTLLLFNVDLRNFEVDPSLKLCGGLLPINICDLDGAVGIEQRAMHNLQV